MSTRAQDIMALLDMHISELCDEHYMRNRRHFVFVRESLGRIHYNYEKLTEDEERRCIDLAMDIEQLCVTRSALFSGLLPTNDTEMP